MGSLTTMLDRISLCFALVVLVLQRLVRWTDLEWSSRTMCMQVKERVVYARERADGLYWIITYLCCKAVEEFTFAGLTTLLFSIVLYFGIGYQGGLLLLWFQQWILTCCGAVIGYAAAAACSDMAVANTLVPTYTGTLMMFAGFSLRYADIPRYWYWYSRINLMHYGWTAIMIGHYKKSTAAFFGGMTTLDYYGMRDHFSSWDFLGITTAFLAFFAIATYSLMSFMKYQKR